MLLFLWLIETIFFFENISGFERPIKIWASRCPLRRSWKSRPRKRQPFGSSWPHPTAMERRYRQSHRVYYTVSFQVIFWWNKIIHRKNFFAGLRTKMINVSLLSKLWELSKCREAIWKSPLSCLKKPFHWPIPSWKWDICLAYAMRLLLRPQFRPDWALHCLVWWDNEWTETGWWSTNLDFLLLSNGRF